MSEQKILILLNRVWKLYQELPETSEKEKHDFMWAIHWAQKLIFDRYAKGAGKQLKCKD